MPASLAPDLGPEERQGEAAALGYALERGAERLVSLQEPDGAWRGDYGGPGFLLPLYVIGCRAAGRELPPAWRAGIVRTLRGVQAADGSFGLHVETGGSMFVSALDYVALRFLGVPADDPQVARLRRWIREHGTPLGAASWGKLILAVVDLHDWDGVRPVLPELWLLPTAAPIHPGRLWCHTRQVYLPMAWLYGRRARVPADGLVRQLRAELYDQPYEAIRWRDHRGRLAAGDRLVPTTALLGLAQRAMALYDEHHPRGPRALALGQLLEHLRHEDESTHFIRIGPVNAVLNTLVHFFRGAEGEADLARSWPELDRYLFEGEDGLKMNGYNSTALWDTVFAVQAILASPLGGRHAEALARAHGYLTEQQVLEDVREPGRFHRHGSVGGWPFSDRRHGWPISDCTGEGLRCALALAPRVAEPLPAWRLEAAARLILSMQNADGGWASYERRRGGDWLELLNPSQVFANIMVEHSYPECTASCLLGLARVRGRFPALEGAIARAVRRGERFLRRTQRADGSWEGSWGVCFTYGTWFAAEGLLAAGASASDPALRRACAFLRARQLDDGGWGERAESCLERRYLTLPARHAVQTAWALLTLCAAGEAGGAAAARAARSLIELQEESGDWPRQTLCGVFNRTTLINYESYRRTFPLWALGRYARARGLAQR